MGTSISWNPQGLSRPVMGLLYLCLYLISNTILILISAVFYLEDFELNWHKSVATINGFYKNNFLLIKKWPGLLLEDDVAVGFFTVN
jgi:hypothetical protein